MKSAVHYLPGTLMDKGGHSVLEQNKLPTFLQFLYKLPSSVSATVSSSCWDSCHHLSMTCCFENVWLPETQAETVPQKGPPWVTATPHSSVAFTCGL